MYTRRFRGQDIQIPKDYRGTAFDGENDFFETNNEAEYKPAIEPTGVPFPPIDTDESDSVHTEALDAGEEGDVPARVTMSPEDDKADEGLLSHLGLSDMSFSDILLLLLVILLMKEDNEDTELPILLLLLLLS